MRAGVSWVIMAVILAAAPLVAEQIMPDRLDQLPQVDVVFVGETHDNAVHHLNQARAVAAVSPAAMVFEMLTPQQAALMPADRADAVALEKILGWNAAGWPDFAMYYPIFAAAPAARIYGADVADADVKRAVSLGAAVVFGIDAARYGLTLALPPVDQAARVAEQQTAHCDALPPGLLPGMVQVQRLRDAALARAVIQAVAETGGPVVVITGSGHARRDRGVPAVLRLAAPTLRVLAIGQFSADPGPDVPFDLWLRAPAADAVDPCAAFLAKP